MMKKSDINFISIVALVVAMTVLIFGNNIYQQITGHSFFQNPSSTPNPTMVHIVQQTLQALTASVSTPTTTATPSPSVTATESRTPTNSSIPAIPATNSPVFSVTDVDFAISGQCGNFTIVASITVNEPGSVKYHWIRSDDAIDTTDHPPIVFTEAGTQSVSITWYIAAPGLHWIDIYIDGPNPRQFSRANFSCP